MLRPLDLGAPYGAGDAITSGDQGIVMPEAERDALLRAIASALEVQERAQFDLWARGPFRALVPHAVLVGIELDDGGRVRHVECLRHAERADLSLVGVGAASDRAVDFARAFHAHPELPATIDAGALGPLPPADAGTLVHRTRFVSGAAFYFVLFDVPECAGARCRDHLRLLSSHLKMAWSRVVDVPTGPGGQTGEGLTAREREILDWMARGISNHAISTGLGISGLTLKAHIRKIYRKLDVDCRQAAIARAQPQRAEGRS